MTALGAADDWPAIEQLFGELFDLPPGEQLTRLAQCASPSVRAAVEALLARHAALEAASVTDPLRPLDGARAAALLGHDASATAGLIGRYRLVRPLGRGSMGVVSLAEDLQLGRLVALKRLSAHLVTDPSAVRRFREEARLASAIDHPYVAQVYDIAETADGGVCIAMAFCPGGSLRERLAHGALPLGDVVRIGQQLAAGLGGVHAHGIVHRDIKPENVLFGADGVVRIADFGIAKLAGHQLTRTGTTLGTAAYMSPEQTRGADVDERADLWSVGVVLYEMIAGRRPFAADAGEALVYSIRHDAPLPLVRWRPDVPPTLARVVARCLEKDPARRFADAHALHAALGAVMVRPEHRGWPYAGVAGVAGAAVLAGVVLLAPGRASTVAAGRPVPVAVRIVAADSGPDGPATANMLEEELGRRVAADPALLVRARAAARPLGRADAPTLGARLHVDAVLHGALALRGDSLLLHASLLRTRDSVTAWDTTLSAPRHAVDALAARLAATAHAALHRQFALGNDRASVSRSQGVPPTTDPRAYDLFWRGRVIVQRRDRARYAEAAEYLREAIALDSGFTRAYVTLAELYGVSERGTPAERARMASALLRRVLPHDSTNSEVHRLIGWHALWYERDWSAAGRHLHAAMRADPTNIWAHHAYAAYLGVVGLTDSSLAVTQRAAVLDPVTAATATHLGMHQFWRRRYREAIALLEATLAADTTWRRTRPTLARAYVEVGRYDDAIAQLEHRNLESPVFDPAGLRAFALGRAGRTAEARAVIRQLEERARVAYVSPSTLVAAYLGVGDEGRALDWMERVPGDSGAMVFLLAEPLYDPLRGHPRFERVIARLGLAPFAARARQAPPPPSPPAARIAVAP